MSFERHEGGAARFASVRPDYPEGLVTRLAEAFATAPLSAGAVLDVGSGTGIFSRALRARLAREIAVIGVEPAADMRAQASMPDLAMPGLAYLEGTAERLPAADGSARGVVAATAAHLFSRPEFYAEARRVLAPDGVLAIADYRRDGKNDASAAMTAFMAASGGPKDYGRPDYSRELSEAPGFALPESFEERRTVRLSPRGFFDLAMSSSHAKAVLATLGKEKAEADLHALAASLVEGDAIPFGYIFSAYVTRRG